MYRPPENSNRVKSIKCLFENIENQKDRPIDINKNATKSALYSRAKTDIVFDKTKLNLSRQLSDPAKRNIKRTPAFRIDKSSEKCNVFERSVSTNKSCNFESKIKQYNSALKNNCDDNKNVIDRTDHLFKSKENVMNVKPPTTSVMISKGTPDFAYIRSKFDQNNLESANKKDENQRNETESNKPSTIVTKQVSSLYTEPIPKSLRNKICDTHVYSNVNIPREASVVKNDSNVDTCDDNLETENNIYNSDTLKITDDNSLKTFLKNKISDSGAGLTDSLKSALTKPLPAGPAPKKPPRTFKHTAELDLKDLGESGSFLHGKKYTRINPQKNKSSSTRKDPRYMLSMLEQALKNNKIKSNKKPVRTEASTTSGEDSDDSLLFRSKSKRDLPSPPDLPTPTSPSSSNFNCLNGLTFSNSTYEKIGEPNSTFFVNFEKREEPLYAEPGTVRDTKESLENNTKNIRNSLYYMSTPLLNHTMDVDQGKQNSEISEGLKHSTPQKQISAESSSLSSFTSDLDSAASTPLEEGNNFESSVKIKQLINAFETQQVSSSPKKAATIFDSTHRVEDLKQSLQKTLEKCLVTEPTNSPEMKEKDRKVSVVDTIVNKFQTYVKTMPKYQKPILGKNDRLFYCCLIVGYDLEKPQIKFKFPSNVKIPHKIEDLCFPEAASGPLDKSNNAQCYSLVITNDKGERTFGYCRRVMPEGSTRCIPLAYCILSKHRAPRFYKKILMELESRHGIPDKLRDELISEFYYNKFPRPGESIKINLTGIIKELKTYKHQQQVQQQSKEAELAESTELVDSLDLNSYICVSKTGEYGTLNKVKRSVSHSMENIFISDDDKLCSTLPSIIVESNEKTELVLTLHHDTRYEEADLKPLHKLPSDVLLKVFASLLLERKVIFISCVISKLSCCVDALQSILYPFTWPHTFIPILPQCLWDVVESPTPVICGILSVAVVNEHKIEHGIVVDLDERNILIEEGDENSILSDSMKKAWRQGFALANTISPDDYVHSVYLGDAYIKVFIVALKHCKSHIVGGNLEKEAFIRNGKTKGIRRFLKWFTETTMFQSFIESYVSNPESFSLLDRKIVTYGSEESNTIMTKLLEWKK